MDSDPDEAEDDQSPVQQSIEIHRRRISTILDRMIEKLCLGCVLQQLRGSIDSKLLSTKQYASLMKMGGNAKKSSIGMSSLRSVRSTSKNKSKKMLTFSQEFARDAHTSYLVAQLHHNAEVMRAVNELVAALSPEERIFIDEIKEFRDYVLELLHTSASAERAYNKRIGEAWVNNENYKKRNAEMEKIHSSKMQEHTLKINEKKTVIANYRQQIAQSHEVCLADLHRIVNESEKFMSKSTLASAEEQEILSEDAKNIANQYQALLEGHLSHEKSLRTKRYKVETVLAGWIAKFDQDIGELQARLEEQEDGYNNEKKIFDTFAEKAEYQAMEHERLMTEKIEEEQKRFDRKLYLFIANRSARIIQRWWRVIYNKFFVKKKGKKGKKKK